MPVEIMKKMGSSWKRVGEWRAVIAVQPRQSKALQVSALP
jgi:hypothetical protein